MDTASLVGLEFGSLSMIDMRGTQLELFKAGSVRPSCSCMAWTGWKVRRTLLRNCRDDFTVYAPSHPGFGASKQREGLNRVDDLGYFYLDMMDQLGLDRPVIVGTTFGAWVAAEILTKEPSRASAAGARLAAWPARPQTAATNMSPTFSCCRVRNWARRMQVGEPGPLQDIMRLPEERLRRADAQ